MEGQWGRVSKRAAGRSAAAIAANTICCWSTKTEPDSGKPTSQIHSRYGGSYTKAARGQPGLHCELYISVTVLVIVLLLLGDTTTKTALKNHVSGGLLIVLGVYDNHNGDRAGKQAQSWSHS